MWSASYENLPSGRRYLIKRNAQPATFADVIAAWQTDAAFRVWLNALLADAPYRAFRWETPGVTVATAHRPFEFVLLDAPSLAREPDRGAFAEHFAPGAAVARFANLSGDSVLIAPAPLAADDMYGHLAAFVRGAPAVQVDALWRAVGDALARRLSAKPVWLSTAGAGVSWLHVRLDDRPKYYGHAPYRAQPA